MAITNALYNTGKQVMNFFWPDEPAPSLEDNIRDPKAHELLPYKFERIDPAISSDILHANPFIYAVHVAGTRMLDPTNLLALQLERENSLNKQRQHIEQQLQTAADKTNKVERWMMWGGMLSMVLTFAGPKLPALAGSALESSRFLQGVVGLFPPSIGGWINSIQSTAAQKKAAKQIETYGPGFASMPQQAAQASAYPLEQKANAHAAVAQTWQGKADALSGRSQEYKQNQETLARVASGVIETEARIGEKVAAATA